MRRIKVLTVFGTRPEIVKLAPVIKALETYRSAITSKVCVTAQHREMLDPLLSLFRINPDYDLNIMQPNQDVFYVTTKALAKLKEVLELERPDFVLVQGDTTTAFAAALSAFYLKIEVGHVEAGLRSGNKYNPFPEEINRVLISHIADLHFAPTEQAKLNLLTEGVSGDKILVTGNTVVDALFRILELTKDKKTLLPITVKSHHKIILVTAHRRESFGEGITGVCLALKEIVERAKDVEIVFPVHLNPNVKDVVYKLLSGVERIHLVDPMDYISFVHLMQKAYLILTDSGGIQEEAPSLSKPVLVLRDQTERPEIVKLGGARLVGTDPRKIVQETLMLLADRKSYEEMAAVPNPYGDGHAAERIVEGLIRFLGGVQ